MRTIAIISILVLGFFGTICPTFLQAQGKNEKEPGRMIVRFKEGVNPQITKFAGQGVTTDIPKLNELNAEYHCTAINSLCPGVKLALPIYCLLLAEDINLNEAIAAFQNSGLVEYAEPDHIGYAQGKPAKDSLMPNDLHFSDQWSLHNDGSFWAQPVKVDADIDMTEAWMVEQGDTNVVVGIIDSGCKLDHPELSGRIWINKNEIAGNGIDDDGDGLTDDWRGWDYANNDNNPTDDYGHGTNVAGIIGCNGNNSAGFAGVDWNCKLMILKGINADNWGYYSWWISSINYAVNKGADVINMSVGGSDPSQGLTDAVTAAIQSGVTIVACMMNSNDNVAYIPASIPGVIAVGATDPDDRRSHPFFWSTTSGSCYGSHISVVAPGNYIYGLSYTSNTSYNSYWGGTSQATPHVAGLAALLKAQDNSRTPAEIKNILQKTAEDQVGDPSEDTFGWDQYYGFGRVNAYDALTYNPSGVELSKENIFSLYPNPASTLVSISWNATALHPKKYIIYASSGCLVKEEAISTNADHIQLSTEGMSPGLYYLVLKTGKPSSYGEILIVQ
ncbi:MAG: S8 family serine peptidase [Bacteroidetes bacterium]|nr:S8 family serine peptidase [Bacteroidota bacterium]